MERKVYGIFVAGGQGTRMGSAVPKQFLTLDGEPVLQRTIERFLEAWPDMEVVTVLPADHMGTWKNLCAVNGFSVRQHLVKGGITRYHSVQNALRIIPDGAIVLIHDGVRPLISNNLIRTICTRMLDGCRALIPVTPSYETLKALDKAADGTLTTSDSPDPDRAHVFGAQTPQAFFSEDIKDAYTQAFDMSFTDDASVLRKKGKPLSWIIGERLNIKITSPEDLVLAEAIINATRCRNGK